MKGLIRKFMPIMKTFTFIFYDVFIIWVFGGCMWQQSCAIWSQGMPEGFPLQANTIRRTRYDLLKFCVRLGRASNLVSAGSPTSRSEDAPEVIEFEIVD